MNWFDIKQFLFLDGEEFIRNPVNELKKVENFLGLRPLFKAENFKYDEKKKFYCFNNNHQTQCLGIKSN